MLKYFIIFLTSLPSGLVAKDKTLPTILKACYDEWAPMQMTAGKAKNPAGILHDIFAEVFAASGIKVEYKGPMPYARVIYLVEEGECDTTPVTVLGVSKRGLYPKTPIYKSKYVFYTRRDLNWKYEGTKSLDGISIATIASYNYSSMDADYQKYLEGKKSNVSTIAGDSNGLRILKMLAAGRLDMFCEDQYVGLYNIKKYNLEKDVKVAGELKQVLSLYPIFTPKSSNSQKLIEIYEKNLAELKANGGIRRIYQKYSLEPD